MNRRHFLQLSGGAIGAAASSIWWRDLETIVGAAAPKSVGPVSLDPDLPVHPLLQYAAAVDPGKKMRVIVQTTSRSANGQSIAAMHGATHLEEFSFVKAHHMELPLKNVTKMGLHKDVLYISPDGPTHRHTIPTSSLKTVYPIVTAAGDVWNGGSVGTGKGVTVAVIDTGWTATADWPGSAASAKVITVNVNKNATSAADAVGHGTHVASVINGRDAMNNYIGVAPDATVVSVKIADDSGVMHEADLLRGLQWCYDNRASYGGIRVVNLSVSSGVAESYRTSPVCAAAEQLWLNGTVVVAAAGNKGTAKDAVWYAPANDPYVIAVGALDDGLTGGYGDDKMASFSSYGKTQDGYAKPDILASGRKVYAALASPSCVLAQEMPSHISADNRIRLSGTSMAAPQVAGVCALLLQLSPKLTPNQIKALLINGGHVYPSSNGIPGSLRSVNAHTATDLAKQTPLPSANAGLTPNYGIDPSHGNTVAWGTAYWDSAHWDAYWDSNYWDAYWDTDQTLD